MRHLSKPQLPIGDILQDCANSYRSTTQRSIKERLQTFPITSKQRAKRMIMLHKMEIGITFSPATQ